MKSIWKNRVIFIVVVLNCIQSIGWGLGNGILMMNISRTFGVGLGKNIQGTFTIHGSGPSYITSLSVTFNEFEVANSSSNIITFKFKTQDYPQGEVNITLWGSDAEGFLYSTYKVVYFFNPIYSYFLLGGLIVVIIGALILKYGYRIRKSIFQRNS